MWGDGDVFPNDDDCRGLMTIVVVQMNGQLFKPGSSGELEMAKRAARRPTDAELTILRVLWEHGLASVREVNRVLNETRPTGYTTTLKQMQVMTAKGLLVRDESRRPQIYRPAVQKDQTQQQLVKHLIDRAFNGSARKLVLQALQAIDVSAAELERVEKLLSELEGDKQ